MANDLEQRRRAIADALRAIMAEPLPNRHHQALQPPAVTTPSVPQQQASNVAVLDYADELEDEWDDGLTDREDVIVPPVEIIGGMSRMASLALFGHA